MGKSPLFAGRVAVVTGAASGQGRATAIGLAREGAVIGALDLDAELGATLEAEIGSMGGTCLFIETDVASAEAVDRAFEVVRVELGPSYILAAAAGVWSSPCNLVNLDVRVLHDVFAINVFGSVHCARAAAQQMLETGDGGRILFWSSGGARRAVIGAAPYAGSKAAIEGISRVLAAELAPEGILVNVIAPGIINTKMSNVRAELDLYAGLLPVRRVGNPDDVAALAVFLCSPQAAFITGTTIEVDGGAGAINGMFATTRRFRENPELFTSDPNAHP
jgi:NAD(P)-dependent dehydrogenase (short-subunit alcohol dehydrogenase family)